MYVRMYQENNKKEKRILRKRKEKNKIGEMEWPLCWDPKKKKRKK